MSWLFNGTTNQANLSQAADGVIMADSGVPFSCVAWIKPRTIGENSQGHIVARAGGTTGPALRLIATNTIGFVVDGATDLVKTANDSLITMDVWQPVAVTWDGVFTTASSVRLYVNGSEVSGYQTSTDGATPVDNSAQVFRIGNNQAGSRTFNGFIAHVQIFNRVLNLNEIWAASYLPGSVRDGLQGYWALYSASGTNETDLSGNNRSFGAVTTVVTGPNINPPVGRNRFSQRSRAVYYVKPIPAILTETNTPGSRIFNGTSDLISCKSIAAIDSFQIYSVCAWIKIRTMPTTTPGTICSKKDGALNGWEFYVDNSNNRIGLSVGFAGTDGVFTTGNNSINTGEWHHVAFAYDTTDLLSGPQIYIDGVAQTVSSTLPTVGVLDDSGAPFVIGSYNSTDFLNAAICRVSYFNRFLTRGEVVQEMRIPGSVPGAKLSLPIFGTSDPEPDMSGNKNNGTVTGTFAHSGPGIGRTNRLTRNRFAQKFLVTAQAYTADLSLSMTVGNTLSKNDLKALTQAISVAETKALNLLKALTQTATLSNTLSKNLLKVLIQAIVISETKSINTLKPFIESITVSESKSLNTLKVFSLAIVYSEAKSVNFMKVLADTMTIVDSLDNQLTNHIETALTLAIVLNDSASLDFLKVLSQFIQLSEANDMQTQFSRLFSENITLTESNAKDVVKALVNLMSVADRVTFNMNILPQLLNFLPHGNVETHDLIAMLNDLSGTGMLKMDKDFAKNELITTGMIKQDTQDMRLDQDKIDWDFQNG